MALNPEIRDQAYQFFIEEAPELLQAIESGLLILKQEKNTASVHNLMRFAHSIKGGAASVELEAIATLAHRLENIFKVLYSDELKIDTDLESQLLQAYDCLRLPLMEQIQTGYFDPEQAFDLAEPIFAQLEERFADALNQADTYIPTSADLGVDMTRSIFEVDVAQGLERIAAVVANPQGYEVAGELRAQAEVFAGFAEFLHLPDFGAIAQATLAALEAYPERALEITQLALVDFQQAREAVLAGNASTTSSCVEIKPSPALVALANSTTTPLSDSTAIPAADSIVNLEPSVEPREEDIFSLFELSVERSEETIPSIIEPSFEPVEDDLFSLFESSLELSEDTIPSLFESNLELSEDTIPSLSEPSLEPNEDTISSLFEFNFEQTEEARSSLFELTSEEIEEPIPSLEDIFAGAIATPETEMSEPLTMPEIVAETQTTDEEENLAISGAIVDPTTIAFEHSSEELIALEANTDTLDSEILEVEWAEVRGITEEAQAEIPTLEQVFGDAFIPVEIDAPTSSAIVPVTSTSDALQEQTFAEIELSSTPETLEVAIQQIEQIFESLPELVESGTEAMERSAAPKAIANSLTPTSSVNLQDSTTVNSPTGAKSEVAPTPNLSVRVDVERLGRMNNVVGELAINRNGLSLQNEQLQGSVRELLNRFSRVQNQVAHLQNLSDQMLIAPERYSQEALPGSVNQLGSFKVPRSDFDDFDSLELDNYGVLQSQLQGLLEEMMQLEESVDDIVLFARATDQTLERQRQMLTQLRDELMWARMLPLGEVLNRFPRMLRDLSTTYRKPVSLKLSGTAVLVDKAVLEKLFDPLLHLIRNAFDHGIEPPEIRQQQGKPEQGLIEIRAYHRGSQTIIEVRDDGQGLNLERIGRKALELGLLSAEQLATTPANRLFNLIFEAGFSTANEVSELSGRGVGLDVVRSQLRSLKGMIAVSSEAGVGTTFTLRLPLTLTIAKLLVCFSGSTALALPSDSIEEIVIPKLEQIKQSGTQQFLHWRKEIVPTYRLSELLEYACPLPDTSPTRSLLAVPTPDHWALPMLVIRQENTFVALQVDRLVTEQELVIKPFGSAIAPPSSTYGCTILGDGSLIPVIDATVLLDQLLTQNADATATSNGLNLEALGIESAQQDNASRNKSLTASKTVKVPTVLVVDDAVALRRTLALSLERAGIRVLQARDGREAIERLEQNSDVRGQGLATPSVELVICDIEMPNMNGFEFLSHRRQDPKISKIPVVMLTSRSNDKHRWLAMQLGASAYFTKPYLEQEFLLAIKQLMGQRTLERMPV
ncbi:hybrid sensor histidine kinase/response regulator [Allocoleopsis sp.]|uniref:hybrid sensor histidine kinase/response regulator n=1 Tax=Allocoleopsis sp. TaxID=3088169 RepID=UPI002FCFC509